MLKYLACLLIIGQLVISEPLENSSQFCLKEEKTLPKTCHSNTRITRSIETPITDIFEKLSKGIKSSNQVNTQSVIQCTDGQLINVIQAIVTNSDKTKCPQVNIESTTSEACNDRILTTILATKLCNGKNKCELSIDKNFGMVCECSTQKYLDISYKCIPETNENLKVTNEESNRRNKRYIRLGYNIDNAGYGGYGSGYGEESGYGGNDYKPKKGGRGNYNNRRGNNYGADEYNENNGPAYGEESGYGGNDYKPKKGGRGNYNNRRGNNYGADKYNENNGPAYGEMSDYEGNDYMPKKGGKGNYNNRRGNNGRYNPRVNARKNQANREGRRGNKRNNPGQVPEQLETLKATNEESLAEESNRRNKRYIRLGYNIDNVGYGGYDSYGSAYGEESGYGGNDYMPKKGGRGNYNNRRGNNYGADEYNENNSRYNPRVHANRPDSFKNGNKKKIVSPSGNKPRNGRNDQTNSVSTLSFKEAMNQITQN